MSSTLDAHRAWLRMRSARRHMECVARCRRVVRYVSAHCLCVSVSLLLFIRCRWVLSVIAFTRDRLAFLLCVMLCSGYFVRIAVSASGALRGWPRKLIDHRVSALLRYASVVARSSVCNVG